MDNDLLKRAEDVARTYLAGDDCISARTIMQYASLIAEMAQALKDREWQYISSKFCGCQMWRSNKGNLFTDVCIECTSMPRELYKKIYQPLPPSPQQES